MSRAIIHAIKEPTESTEKLKDAILNLFPSAELSFDGRHLKGETDDLDHFRTLLREQRIRDTAREVLESSTICPGPAAGDASQPCATDDAPADGATVPKLQVTLPTPEETPKATRTAMYLSKNAAFMGKVNVSVGSSPLGDIQLIIEADDLDAAIEELTRVE